jgi:hypothetical protein
LELLQIEQRCAEYCRRQENQPEEWDEERRSEAEEMRFAAPDHPEALPQQDVVP